MAVSQHAWKRTKFKGFKDLVRLLIRAFVLQTVTIESFNVHL